jgi:Flp pilus assembly protein TadD
MPEAGRADHEPQESGQGLALKGQALLAQGQGEEAEAVLSRALTIAREIGNPPQL